MTQTELFKEMATKILENGSVLRFQAHGGSMRPFILDGDILEVEPIAGQELYPGEIILCTLENSMIVAHRVVRISCRDGQRLFLVQGDRFPAPDGFVTLQNILGRVIALERRGRHIDLRSPAYRLMGRLWMALTPLGQQLMNRLAALRAALTRLTILLAALALALASVSSWLFLMDGVSRAAAASGEGLVAESTLTLSSPPATNNLRLLRSDPQGIELELTVPDFEVVQKTVGGRDCQSLQVDGFSESDSPERAATPVRGVMLGIPPQVMPVLTILEADLTPLPGTYQLCLQPQPVFDIDPQGEIHLLGEATASAVEIGDEIPEASPSPVEMVFTGYIRSQAYAQLRFQPFQYDPSTGELRYYRRLHIQVTWPQSVQEFAEVVDEGPFEALLQNTLLNYDTARSWRVHPAPVQSAPAGSPEAETPAYKLSVVQDGIYKVSYADLLAAGAPVDTINPQTFHISNHDVEIAIEVTGEQDGVFDASDYILFYGQKTATRYTDANIYWLTWGNGNGRRMSDLDGAPIGTLPRPEYFSTTLRLEQERYYQPARPSGPDADRWYWDFIYRTGTAVTKSFNFMLNGVAGLTPVEPLTITVSGIFRGYMATPQHHTQVLLNGHLVDEAYWPSEDIYTFEVQLPQSYLVEGANTIQVVCPLGGGVTLDSLFINRFELEYARLYHASNNTLDFTTGADGFSQFQVSGFTTSTLNLFEITTPFTPSRVVNYDLQSNASGYTLTLQQADSQDRRYFVVSPDQWLSPASILTDNASNLRDSAHGADYILITHGNFYTDVLPLAARREAQGLRVVVADVQDVYDEFSAGIFDPQAIHDFLAYAYANWQPPAPAYVLLVGDGNYDFKNFYLRNEPNYIPPYLTDVDPYFGETASDNRFVMVAGDDILPDLFIGRLPVKTSSEASALVSKIMGYEDSPSASGWDNQALFVADNADQGGDFAAFSDIIADDYLPTPYTAQKVYYGVTHTSVSQARTAILSAINQGRLLVNYVGHANIQAWAGENLLTNNDIAGLTNGSHLPFMIPMTCLDGYFIHPSATGTDQSSLGESLVRASGKGAIASWSPTGLSEAYGHDYLDRGLFQALFFDDVTRLGPATTQAKLYLFANTGSYRELVDTYVLLGDPALRLNIPPADVSISLSAQPDGLIMPGEAVTYTLVFSNAGPATAHHVLIADYLEAALLDPVVISTGAAITPVDESPLLWQVADLAVGQGGVITITALTPPDPIYPFANSAVITTSAWETNTLNNLAGPLTQTVALPDLVLTKHGPASVAIGTEISYTLYFANTGPAVAPAVVITDLLDAALLNPTFSASLPGVAARPGSRFVWDVGALAAGQSGIITVTANLDPLATGLLTNTAVIATPVETDTLDNTGGPVQTEIALPDLAISKSGPWQALSGDWITYVVSYANLGGAPAAGVVISDALPAQIMTPTITYSGAALIPLPGYTFAWSVSSLLPGEGGVITITAQIPLSFTGVLANSAAITNTVIESSLSNNTAGPVMTGVSIPDLIIEKEGPPAVLAGTPITYTLSFANQGSALATSVVLTDSLPVSLLNPQVTSSGATVTLRPGSHLVWDVADLLPGEGGMITITAQTPLTLTENLVNQASIAGAEEEAHLENNSAGPVETIGGLPDLIITKTGPSVSASGASIIYTIAYANQGVLPATGVIITDTFPAVLDDPIVASSGAVVTLRPGSRLAWDAADLLPGEGGTITITAQVPLTFTGVLSNGARIIGAQPEIYLENNTASPAKTTVGIADLMISLDGPTQASAGHWITYSLAFTNYGTFPATQVVISDALPTALLSPTVTSSGAAITLRPGSRLVWDVADLSAGEGGMITLTAWVMENFSGTVTNTVYIQGLPELDLADNADQVVTLVTRLPQFHLFLPVVTKDYAGQTGQTPAAGFEKSAIDDFYIWLSSRHHLLSL